MQHVNLQIQKLAPTLLQLRSDAVYHFGQVPSGASEPTTNSLVSGVGEGSFLVGEFTHRDGARYLMVANKDTAKSGHCSLEYRKAPRHVQHVSAYSGALTPFAGEDLWLAPGGGALLKVER